MSWLESLLATKKKKKRIVAGVMSGTSVNSVDVALCRIEGFGPLQSKVELLSFYAHPFPEVLRAKVINADKLSLGELAELNLKVGRLFAQAVRAALKSRRAARVSLDLIGSHGQTIYHHSGLAGAPHASWQVAEGDYLATNNNVPVVTDFRVKDLILGGEGAPLTPYADYILFKHQIQERQAKLAVLNLGGIANVTLLSKDPSKVVGFDLGPANAPLDRLACLLSAGRKRFDDRGMLARKGQINQKILSLLLAKDSFLKRLPPKSTGTEAYGESWVRQFLRICKGSAPDRLATATAFVSQGICSSIHKYILAKQKISKLIVAGGGARNTYLLEQIRAGLDPLPVVVADLAGVPAQAREAMAFAVFANEFLGGFPASLPSVTGATRRAILGKLSLP